MKRSKPTPHASQNEPAQVNEVNAEEASSRRRYTLTEMLKEAPARTPKLEGWDDMPPAGQEIL